MIKIIIITGIVLVVVYIVAAVGIVLAQRQLIYPVPSRSNEDCEREIADEVVTRNNTKLYHQHQEGSDTVVVFYHGNGDIACDKVDLIDIFNEKNISYIFTEYEGYNHDGKKATNEGVLKSVEDTIEFINEQGYEHVYVIGQSIGTGAAAYHASIQPPERLLLISPFTTLTDVVSHMFPMYPRAFVEKFLDDRYNNVERLKDYKGKLIVVHGTKDPVVSDTYGQTLFQHIQTDDKEFIEAKDYGHANIYPSEEVTQAVEKLVQ